MPILKSSEAGVVLMGEFDRAWDSKHPELVAFRRQLIALQKQHGFTGFFQTIEHKGEKIVLRILPAQAEPPRTAAAPPPKRAWGAR